MTLCWTPEIGQLIDLAIAEDLGRGDVTTEAVALSGRTATGTVVARQQVVCCGLDVAGWLAERARLELGWRPVASDGDLLEAGGELATLSGRADAILRVERAALNFLMHLCGVATLTRRFVDAVAGTRTTVVDTRKTTPGWRALEKYAVRTGGGANHRHDLGSGILIKDNHIEACGSIGEAVRRARRAAPHPLRIEVEVDRFEQIEVALEAGAELLLLDNMTAAQIQQAVALIDDRAGIEVSGGVTLETVAELARAGADYVSVGALTHSAPAADLSLELRVDEGA